MIFSSSILLSQSVIVTGSMRFGTLENRKNFRRYFQSSDKGQTKLRKISKYFTIVKEIKESVFRISAFRFLLATKYHNTNCLHITYFCSLRAFCVF